MKPFVFCGAFRSLITLSFAALAVGALAQSTRVGPCVTTETMSVMFAEGTSKADIARTINSIRRFESQNNTDYEPAGRWTLTMYGNTGSYGTACRFGYSFVPDGTIVPNTGLGEGESEIFARFNGLFGGNTNLWKSKFRQMFDAWGNFSGLRYDEGPDDGAPLHFFPGQLGARGDLRIACFPFPEEFSFVLAYNFFPNNGDMVINSNFNWAAPGQDYRFLRNVLGHEHGHGMGLAHVMPMNETKLMEPVLTLAFDGPQSDDVQGCQYLYGDVVEDNDDIGHATDIGMVSSGQSVELLAVERPSDRDWFLVEIPEGNTLTVRAEPVGEIYMVGPQGGNPILRNGRAINDLRLSAYQSDGVTLIGTSNSGGLGFPETLQSIARPPSGVVSVKVDVSTIADDIQRYRLVFLLDGATTTFSPNGYFLIRGNELTGGLFGMQYSDDIRNKIRPRAQSPFQRDYVEFEVSTTSTIQTPTSIVLGYEGSASSQNVRRTLHAWDYVAGAYALVTQGPANPIEGTFEYNLSSPARFVGPGGQMKMKVLVVQTGPLFTYPYEVGTDWVYWRLTQ